MPSFWGDDGKIVDGRFEVNITKIQRVLAFSTTTPLGANAVYTSPTIDAINYKTFNFSVLSDQAGSFLRQHSDDGITWVSEASTSVTANTFNAAGSVILRKFFRVVYTNGATTQTSFNMSLYLSPI
jgi:hypothetical protein